MLINVLVLCFHACVVIFFRLEREELVALLSGYFQQDTNRIGYLGDKLYTMVMESLLEPSCRQVCVQTDCFMKIHILRLIKS